MCCEFDTRNMSGTCYGQGFKTKRERESDEFDRELAKLMDIIRQLQSDLLGATKREKRYYGMLPMDTDEEYARYKLCDLCGELWPSDAEFEECENAECAYKRCEDCDACH